MRILIDGVFFQLAQSGIARVWNSLIPILNSYPDVSIILADRGNCPNIVGVKSVPFPAYHASYAADDSILLQKLCDFHRADIFLSTFFTTPLETPSVQVVYDMIPERFSFDLRDRFWAEKETALSYARWFVCISRTTKSDLLHLYPEISPSNVRFEYLGYDKSIFVRSSPAEIEKFLNAYGLRRPFLLMVGSRDQNKGYKNGKILFEALLNSGRCDLDVLCIGGEEKFDEQLIAEIGNQFRVMRIEATDQELAHAYSAARAFIYPSLYEGFGLPVVEAMACGCPIVTTNKGSLAEIAREPACIIVEPDSVDDMIGALTLLDDESRREAMRAAGLRDCLQYNWNDIGRALFDACCDALKDAKQGERQGFYDKWTLLRSIQSQVNTKAIF
ncbi:glycosyl transferase family protein [Methylobacterium oryzae CBMB20]|uniref:Glycosyl transferase family protein n=2 Tax=Methylobacteriaceae TaxID=119045 RepID=A0A089NTJ8_9HYPH|nr:glycosyl transferase family protein [Methylobacterium oryzae CBMB20]